MAVINNFSKDNLKVYVFDSRDTMGVCAGTEAADFIKECLKTKDSIRVMFAAAPSQNETLSALIADPDIDWSRIDAFHMDEYVGLDPTHPAGFRNFLHRSIFSKKSFKSVNYINGNAADPVEEAARYSALLKEGGLDVCLLGVGENGHIAFNDPPVADFEDEVYVKVVELEDRCRQQQVHDGCFASIDQVPTHAITVTIPGLFQAGAMFCTVPGITKADAIAHMLLDDITTDCPASILRRHKHAQLYIDQDAAMKIL